MLMGNSLLMVRSFSGRYARIRAEARVNVCRAVQEPEDPLVQASKRREMMMTSPTPAIPDDGEHQSMKGLQQVFSRQMSRGPCWDADI